MGRRYKISHSNYTVKKRHQLLSDGVVYERDFMTTTNLGGWDSGSIPLGEGNFRMIHRHTENVRKFPHAGSWLTCGESGNTVWTSASCDMKTGVTEEAQIKKKPNYGSMLDFAYYGSCVELVKSTIKKIIQEFPGEIVVNETATYRIGNTDYLAMENPFMIDIFDDEGGVGIKDFHENYDKYSLVTEGGASYPVTNVTVTYGNACVHGDSGATVVISSGSRSITLYKILYDDQLLTFRKKTGTNYMIRPNDESVKEFFDNLDDFGKLLLNRGSEPKYTAVIDYPHETERGIKTYKRSFTWPMDGDWNLDVRSIAYENYVQELLSIAEFYDNGYTNNLWRMLTHDSIKAMDLAFTNPMKDEDTEDYNDGTTRLEGLLWAYGRQFDELKRAIDNIKATSNVTYDENGNLPDYFLSDSLELSGWEVYNADKGIEGESITLKWGNVGNDVGVSKEYTSEDANNTFLRMLKLNSKDILKKKGTRDGIVSILGLFGMKEGVDFEMHEEIALVSSQIESVGLDEEFEMARLNSLKMSYPTSVEELAINPFEGIPFTYVETDSKKYIVPWFEHGVNYDGDTYFQMKGGWEKSANISSEAGKYKETLNYLSVVPNQAAMLSLPKTKAYKGAICYVENIGDSGATEYEHYFTLVDEEHYDSIYSWRSSTEAEVDYINSVVNDYKANNPHVGFGSYDGGKEFIERIKAPFSYHVSANTEDNPMFSDAAYDCSGNYDEGFLTTKVDVDEHIIDDKKVWFFGNSFNASGNEGVEKFITGQTIFDFETETDSNDATEAAANSVINTKVINFVFYCPVQFIPDFKKYLEDVVLPYMKQVLPSTAIWGYEIKAKDTIAVEPFGPRAETFISITADYMQYDENSKQSDDLILNYNELHDIKL